MGTRLQRFWLEWDRGTMNVRDLSVKFEAYAHFLATREWAREDIHLPGLLVVAPEVAQEQRVQRVAQTRLADTTGLDICTTTMALLREQGPLAPIWSPVSPPEARTLPRRGVFEMI